MNYSPPRWVLAVIIVAQFSGTSLWFAGNAILPELKIILFLNQYAVSLVTTAIMLGFISGTLIFAFLGLADRYSPARLFFISTLLGAISNLLIIWLAIDPYSLFGLRFATGVCLAGIYPVGMKIAADWFDKSLGRAMGYLLGALVLGTAFPHLLKNRDYTLPWELVLISTSVCAVLGGVSMLLFVGDGPYRKKSGPFDWRNMLIIFTSDRLRWASGGYFGHMWELYTFWGFLPIILQLYADKNQLALNVPLWSFFTISIGSLGCVLGGYMSLKWGNARVATMALLLSGLCGLCSPFIFHWPLTAFLALILLWGLTVIPDSPQYSTLVAQFAPPALKGTALTIYNAIGFGISTLSLLIIDRIYQVEGTATFVWLSMGALVGLPPMIKLIRTMVTTAASPGK